MKRVATLAVVAAASSAAAQSSADQGHFKPPAGSLDTDQRTRPPRPFRGPHKPESSIGRCSASAKPGQADRVSIQ